jgi:hypothetical protein
MTKTSFPQLAPQRRKCFMFRPMNIRLLGHRALKSLPIVLLAVLAFGGSASAATNEIEGTWSFEHGAVFIEPVPNSNTFQGTVVEETTLVACPHTVGETMWTGMTQLPDGSFAGFHKWFIQEGANHVCKPDPQNGGLGKTAWRVFTSPSGEKILKACFSSPNNDSQPTIALDGQEAGATFGCTDLKQLAPAPGSPGSPPPVVVLPPAKACVAQSSLKIALKEPKFDPLTEVVVKIGSKKVADVKGIKKIKKGITLKKLPTGTYKISVVATTILKQRLTGSQTYKACTKGSGKIKLKGGKKHH